LKKNHVAGTKDNPTVATIADGVGCRATSGGCNDGCVVVIVTAHSGHFMQFLCNFLGAFTYE
jgi:hypothetical protein